MSLGGGKRLAVVLAPKGELGESLMKEAFRWHAAGMINDFIWASADWTKPSEIDRYVLNCVHIADGETGKKFDLFQLLGNFQINRLDLIVPWVLATGVPDEALAQLALKLGAALDQVLPTANQTGRVVTKRLFKSLVSIASIENLENELAPVSISYKQFDANIVVSPEVRATPWAASSPLKSEGHFVPFALAQITAIAGSWWGVDESVTQILSKRGYEFGTGNPILLRTLATAVVAQGVAGRMIVESLSEVGDPTVNIYADYVSSDSNRPRAIANDKAQIDQLVNPAIDAVIKRHAQDFLYDNSRKPKPVGHDRGWKEAFRFFGQFLKDTVFAFPMHTKNFLLNKVSSFANKTLTDVSEAAPEALQHLDTQLRDRLAEIEKFTADTATQDAIATTTMAYRQDPRIWLSLREAAVGLLDGYGFKGNGHPNVLPSVNFVASDPSDLFTIDEQFAEMLEIAPGQLDEELVGQVRSKALGVLRSSNDQIDEMRSRLVALQRSAAQEAEAAEELRLEAERAEERRIAEETFAQEMAEREAEAEEISANRKVRATARKTRFERLFKADSKIEQDSDLIFANAPEVDLTLEDQPEISKKSRKSKSVVLAVDVAEEEIEVPFDPNAELSGIPENSTEPGSEPEPETVLDEEPELTLTQEQSNETVMEELAVSSESKEDTQVVEKPAKRKRRASGASAGEESQEIAE